MSETRLETFSSAMAIVMGMEVSKEDLCGTEPKKADGRTRGANEKFCSPKKEGQSPRESGGTKMTERQIYKREQSVYEAKMILES